jgi:hypothetical protein
MACHAFCIENVIYVLWYWYLNTEHRGDRTFTLAPSIIAMRKWIGRFCKRKERKKKNKKKTKKEKDEKRKKQAADRLRFYFILFFIFLRKKPFVNSASERSALQ